MDNVQSDFLKVAEALSTVKKQEVFLPITLKEAIVTPLLVGDDVSLRTSVMSPANYDKELIRLLYKHSTIFDKEKNPIQANLQQFMANLSNIDKVSLIWAVYKATYETLGDRTMVCKVESCKDEYKHKLSLEELIQEDTFVPWDKDKTFHEYRIDIPIEYADKFIYTFTAKLPSILDNNRILSLVPIDALQNTLETTGDLFTRSERLTLLVDKIGIEPMNETQGKKVESSGMSEILRAFDHYIPYDIADVFLSKYSKEFDKYIPQFYTMTKCDKCGELNRLEVDLEVELFRRILLGAGKE